MFSRIYDLLIHFPAFSLWPFKDLNILTNLSFLLSLACRTKYVYFAPAVTVVSSAVAAAAVTVVAASAVAVVAAAAVTVVAASAVTVVAAAAVTVVAAAAVTVVAAAAVIVIAAVAVTVVAAAAVTVVAAAAVTVVAAPITHDTAWACQPLLAFIYCSYTVPSCTEKAIQCHLYSA